MNRRTLLASGAAAAASTPAWGSTLMAEGSDPALEAVRRWAQLLDATVEYAETYSGEHEDIVDCPTYAALDAATEDAFRRVVATTPTTLAGMAAMVRMYAAQDKLGDLGSRFSNTDTWSGWPVWADAREQDLLMAILAAGGQGAVWETGA